MTRVLFNRIKNIYIVLSFLQRAGLVLPPDITHKGKWSGSLLPFGRREKQGVCVLPALR